MTFLYRFCFLSFKILSVPNGDGNSSRKQKKQTSTDFSYISSAWFAPRGDTNTSVSYWRESKKKKQVCDHIDQGEFFCTVISYNKVMKQ